MEREPMRLSDLDGARTTGRLASDLRECQVFSTRNQSEVTRWLKRGKCVGHNPDANSRLTL